MPDLPILELTFRNVGGDPWEGEAVARFDDEPSKPFAVREGLTGEQHEKLRWYVERYLDFPEGGYVTRAKQIEHEMDEYGRELWKGLQAPQVDRWLGAVHERGGGRLELRAETKEDEVSFRSPWELLRIGDQLLHQLTVTVVRRPNSELPRRSVPDTSKGLRVLVVVCRPEGAGFLDPRYTPQAILKALSTRPEVRVDFCRPGTITELMDRLDDARDQEEPYHVVHFDGHGMTLPHEDGIGALCFEKDDGTLDEVRAHPFGDVMSDHRIPLVVLEACRTSTPSFAQETVASELLRRQVGTVVAMGHAVHVDMTRELMAAFYAALTKGLPVGEALRRARNRVYAKSDRRLRATPDAPTEKLRDWFVPQLYQGGDDPVLLEARPQVAHAHTTEPDLRGFPPPPRAGFEGRGRELHRLERALLRHPVTVLAAPGGTGKTALAREAAHWWTRTGWFEAALFVSFEGRPSPEKVVTEVGLALEGQDFYKQEDPAGWVAQQLAQRRLLLVWDNFESVLPPFQNGEPMPPELAELAKRWTAGGARILVTSRSPEVLLPGAQPVDLWTLSDPEALGLLVRLLDKLGKGRAVREKLGWDAKTLQPLIDTTGGHPLALELVTPYLEQFSPEEVVADLGSLLREAEQEHGAERNRTLWASLEFSLKHLSAEAREALPAVALMAGGCVELMARDVAGLDDEPWERVKGELERTGVVRVSGQVLRPHPVLAEVEALAPSPEVEERFFAVVRQLCGEFDQVARSQDSKRALATMAVNEVVAHRAINRALAAGRVDVTWFVADSLKGFLERTGRAGEGRRLMGEVHDRAGGDEDGELTQVQAKLVRQAAWARAAQEPAGAVATLEGLLLRLEAVEDWDPRHERAQALMTLGRVHYNFLGRPAAALEPLEKAERLFVELEQEGADSTNRAVVLGDRANALMTLGRHDEALAGAEEGLALDRERGDTSAVARDLHRTAHILMDAGRLGEAEARSGEALEAAREAGDDEALGILYQQFGILTDNRGRYDEAEGYYRRALETFERAGDLANRMRTLNLLGEAERKRGNLREAQTWYERSRALAERLQDLPSQAAARSNLAVLHSHRAEQTEDPDETRRWLHRAIAEERQALDIEKTLGRPASIAISRSNLANRLRRAGQLDEAEEQAREALAIREEIGDPRLWQTLLVMADIAAARGDDTAAAEWGRRKEEAYAEARERAGVGGLGAQQVGALFQLAHAARAHGVPLGEALAQTDAPDDLLDQIRERDPWLLTHLQALAGGEGRPEAKVPALYTEAVDAAWRAVG